MGRLHGPVGRGLSKIWLGWQYHWPTNMFDVYLVFQHLKLYFLLL